MKPLGVLTSLLVGMTMALATTPTPFISVDSGGNLFAAPFSQDDPGDANLTTLCNRLGMGRDDLLIALHVYMEREKHVVFVPNPNRAYFNALISVVAADSGLNTLLDAAYTNGALPNTPLGYYITAVKNAVQALGLNATTAKSHDCGTCGPLEYPGSAYCGPGLCVKGCGAYSGGCSETGGSAGRLGAVQAYFDSYGL